MFKGSLPGMDLVFHTDPPQGSVITLVGGAGTLKSALAYAVVAGRLNAHPDERAIYFTLEETKDGHLANLGSLGFKPHPRIAILDIASLRAEIAWMSKSCGCCSPLKCGARSGRDPMKSATSQT